MLECAGNNCLSQKLDEPQSSNGSPGLLLTNKEEPVGDEIINGSLDCGNCSTQENVYMTQETGLTKCGMHD